MSEENKSLEEVAPLLADKESEAAFREVAQESLKELVNSIAKQSAGSPANPALLNGLIKSNQLQRVNPAELQKWLYDKDSPSPTSPELVDIDRRVLTSLASTNPGLVNRAANARGLATERSKRTHQVCKIEAINTTGRSEKGTGFFLTDNLIMTCWHVIKSSQTDGGEIIVSVPHFHGPNRLLTSVNAWSAIEYSAVKSQNRPLILAGSTEMAPEHERGSWDSIPANAQKGLDYAIFEVDLESEKWTISVTADVATMNYVNANFVFYVLPTEFPSMNRPTSLYQADDLLDSTVKAYTLSDRLKLEPKDGGSVREASQDFNRIRYGDGNNGIHEGDSGCPLILTENNQLAALHNASAGNRSQAIPIGAIYEDLESNERTKPLLSKILPQFA